MIPLLLLAEAVALNRIDSRASAAHSRTFNRTAAHSQATVMITEPHRGRQLLDDRALVQDTTQYPYSAIGLFRIIQSGQSNQWCTGALIAPSFVLTAAHCVYDLDTGSEVEQGDFTPGYNPSAGNESPFGTAQLSSTWVPQAFINCGTGAYTLCHQASVL